MDRRGGCPSAAAGRVWAERAACRALALRRWRAPCRRPGRGVFRAAPAEGTDRCAWGRGRRADRRILVVTGLNTNSLPRLQHEDSCRPCSDFRLLLTLGDAALWPPSLGRELAGPQWP